MSKKTLLVSGASGHLGRLVLEELLASGGGHRLVATTRDPQSLASFAARGVEVRKADFDQGVEELAAAFAGADRLLLVSTNSLDRPGRRAEQHLRAVAAAKVAGVRHLVYTSTVNAQDPGVLLAGDHAATEAALAESGIGHTVLRNCWYAQNLEGDLRHALVSGTLALATGSGRVGFVSREDCARAAAAALSGDFEGVRVLDVTGPEALTVAEVAARLSAVAGKEIAGVALPGPARLQGLEAAGLPSGFAAVLVDSELAMGRGWLDSAPGAVEALTGRAPSSLDGYLRGLLAG